MRGAETQANRWRERLRQLLSPHLLLTLLIAAAAALPLLAEPGLLNSRGGGDSPFLLQRLQQLETAVRDGHFPVRWMPDANYGYGYPFYNYYAPLSIYIPFFFRILGFSFVRAIQMAQLAGFLTAAGGMYLLGRRWFGSKWAGLLSGAAYTVAPFHLVNVYVRGDSLAEFWAMAFYPLTILAADRLFTNKNDRGPAVALFALAYAALILSHNISALIFSPFLLLYVLLRWQPDAAEQQEWGDRVRLLLPAVAGFLLAFALAAWFFLPALAEQGLAQLGAVTEGYFHYSTHFLGQENLPALQESFFFNYAVDGRTAFRMGLIFTLAGGVALLLLQLPRLELRRHHRLFIFLTALISTGMLLPLSGWLWANLPLLSYTQFPWRFLSIQAFGLALALGAVSRLPGRGWIASGTAALLLLSSLAGLRTDHLRLTDADITAARLAQYEWFTGNIGTTVSFEYLPATVATRPYTSPWLLRGARDEVTSLQGELGHADLRQRSTTKQEWQIEANTETLLMFPTLYWPGWGAQLDGQPLPLQPAPGSGLITAAVPAGTHTLTLQLGRTPVRLAAELLSAAALLPLLWLLWSARRRRWRAAGTAVLLLLPLALLLHLWPRPPLSPQTLNWDFAQLGYLHHAPAGIPFSGELLLQEYEISQEAVAAGERVIVETVWAGDGRTEAVLELVTPAAARPQPEGQAPPPVISSAAAGVQSGTAVFTLNIPDTAPAGLFVPRLRLADGSPLTTSGLTRGDLFLRPVQITPAANSAALETTAPLELVARGARIPAPDRLELQLAWQTAAPLSVNYNVALRLTDAHGNFLRLADMQPGYGHLPSSSWPAGEPVQDWLALALPAEEHQWPWFVVAQLYDPLAPETAVLTRRLGTLEPAAAGVRFQPHAPRQDALPGAAPAAALWDERIDLQGYTQTITGSQLRLSLLWEVRAPLTEDVTRFVHLIPVAGGAPLLQVDSYPVGGTYPTSQWTPGETIVDTVTFDLANLPAAEYRLAVGFYARGENGQFPRLLLTGADGQPIADDMLLLPPFVFAP